MRLTTLVLLAALAAPAACDAAEDAPPSARASIPAGADTTLAVAGATFVSLFPAVTRARLDADEGVARALKDFEHHLGEAAPVLRAAGVAVHDVTGRRVRLVAGDPPRPLAGVNADAPRYVLIEPGRAPYVLEGVQTNAALLRAAAVYFRIPALQSHAR